jgi:hypothetical protein
MALRDAMQIDLLKHAVLRAAAWPIEAATDFRAADLARAASALFETERNVLARRHATVARLYSALTRFDAQTRAYLLSLKRHVYCETSELPKPTPEVAARLAKDDAVARLIEEETAARRSLAEQSAEFDRMYTTELERQRCLLRTRTAEPRFLKALIIANPLVAARWDDVLRGIAGPARKERRLERTVFRYLMRAAGRPTPHGAWAGVALVSPAPAEESSVPLQVCQEQPFYLAVVNLLPFTLMVGRLIQLDRYRQTLPLRLNPTLHQADGGWRYAKEGDSRWVVLPHQRFLSAVLQCFADGHSRPVLPILKALDGGSGGNPDLRASLERIFQSLIDTDVLRVDLSLPARASHVWEALDAVVPRLLEPERTRWAAAIRRIRSHCEQLGSNFETLKPVEVDSLMSAIQDELQRLWQAAGMPGSSPEPPVRLDMRLPFGVQWSCAAFDAATRATRDVLEFHAADGGAELFRHQSLFQRIRFLDGGNEEPLLPFLAAGAADSEAEPCAAKDELRAGACAATRELLLSGLPHGSPEAQSAAAHCQMWESVLEPVHHERVHALPRRAANGCSPAGPWGSLLLRFNGNNGICIGPGRPESMLFSARFAPLIGKPRNGDAPFLEELRTHASAAAANGIELADIVGWHPFNPNAAIRPSLITGTLDAQGPPETNLQNLYLRVQPGRRRPWLVRSEDPRPLLPIMTCAANVAARDSVSSALAAIASAHGWEFLAFGFPPLHAERLHWHHLPKLLLNERTILSAERWTLDKRTVTQLRRANGSARYLAWRREVERRGIPALVHIRTGTDAPELLMCTESPLAVQCCFDGADDRASEISLTELPDCPDALPLKDAEGRHYLSEIAVTWCADQYWSGLAREINR